MFLHYLELAWRNTLAAKGLSALMVLALALGIGACMTTLTVYHVLSGDPIPHKSERLFNVQLDASDMIGWKAGEEPNFDLSRFAEPLDGPTAAALGALARTHGLSLAGPVVEREGPLRFNTLCLFGPDGARVARWQKRHPWYPERWASEGRHCFEVVEHRGLTFTACICFDVHFVADDASASLQRSDVLLYPSAWVDEGDDDARAPLLEGLATRFELTVVNANWGVGVPAVPGQGRSRIVSPSGACFEASDAPWSAAVATVDRRGANGVVAE